MHFKLGVVTTGHGPRDEYVRYHRGLGRKIGVDVEVIDRHILEGLAWDEIRLHLGGEDDERLGAHVRVPGARGNRLGPDWDHVYVRLTWALDHVQKAIDGLVADGADAILLCCATAFSPDAFRCRVPLIRPATLMSALVAERIATWPGRVRFGLTSSAGHARQDVALWQQQPFADRLDILYEPFEGDILPASGRLAARRPDLVVVWSYGLGLAGQDIESLTARMEDEIGCPVMMPHRIAGLAAFGLARCGFDDRALVRAGETPLSSARSASP